MAGKVERHRWDLSGDTYDIVEQIEADDPIHTFDALMSQLQGMGRGAVDFRSALIHQLQVRGVAEDVREAIMQALE